MMVLTFTHSSMTLIICLACLHCQQQIPHAWVSVSMDSDDVIAALPVDDLKALFDMKMANREYFKTLLTAL